MVRGWSEGGPRVGRTTTPSITTLLLAEKKIAHEHAASAAASAAAGGAARTPRGRGTQPMHLHTTARRARPRKSQGAHTRRKCTARLCRRMCGAKPPPARLVPVQSRQWTATLTSSASLASRARRARPACASRVPLWGAVCFSAAVSQPGQVSGFFQTSLPHPLQRLRLLQLPSTHVALHLPPPCLQLAAWHLSWPQSSSLQSWAPCWPPYQSSYWRSPSWSPS